MTQTHLSSKQIIDLFAKFKLQISSPRYRQQDVFEQKYGIKLIEK